MRIDVLTLFPGMFDGVFGASILGKAREKGLVELNTVNFRDFANNKHSTVDDYPYGGGGGMVLKAEPIFAAVEDLLERRRLACSEKQPEPGREPEASQDDETKASVGQEVGAESQSIAMPKAPRVILMCPQGEPFSQKKAEELSAEEHLVFICGHYEGYDERIREYLVTDELSIGDYVLTGGELPAMVVIDSVVRLLPGVLGNETSAVTESFSTGLLEYPHYTRPVKFRDWEVPDILLSGHHSNIADWRRKQSILRTWRKRPELLESAGLTPKEKMWLESLRQEEANQDKQ